MSTTFLTKSHTFCNVIIVSFIAEEIARQMESQSLDQTTLATKSGFSQSQISKWLNDKQVTLDAGQLRSLQTALSNQKEDHARLAAAHLKDENFGLGAELVRVEVDMVAEFKDRPRPRTKGESAIEYLNQARIESKDINDLLIDLARCLGADL